MFSKKTVSRKFSEKCASCQAVKNSGMTNTIALIVALLVAVAAAVVVFTVVKNKKDGGINKTTTESSSFSESISETIEEETSTEKESSKPDKPDETAYKSSEMNEELAEQKFNEFLEVYYQWYSMSNVVQRYLDANPKVLDSGLDGYPITDKNINYYEDITDKFLAYCTESVRKSLPTFCEYEECDGHLYLAVEASSYYDYTFIVENVDRKSDDIYTISTLCVAQEIGEPTLIDCKWTYNRTDDGTWLLTEYKELHEWTYDFDTNYRGYVKTEGSDLNIRKYPTTNSEIVGRAKNGSSVSVYSVAEEWAWVAYSSGDNQIEGWVKTEYLR